MASAAEQLAANINFASIGKAEELKKRIWFTLGALMVYRLGTYIPLPGIDPDVFAKSFTGQKQGVLELFNMFSGGAVQRMAIFALNIMPYISASIIIQLMTSVVPSLETLKKEGESGRKVINQYTRYLTVILAAFQAYGISVGLEGQAGVVTDPGLFFRVSCVITLMGGTMFLMWLGEQITSRGIGNGSSLIIFAGIIAAFPAAIGQVLELGRQGAISAFLILAVVVVAVATIALHRLHGAGAAARAHHLSEAAGRQPHVRGPDLVPAAEAQHVGRDPADLRLVAAAAAHHGRQFHLDERRRRLGWLGTIVTSFLGHGQPALHPALHLPDRVLCLLLHRRRVQPEVETADNLTQARRLRASASAPASAPRNTSTRSSPASPCWAPATWRSFAFCPSF